MELILFYLRTQQDGITSLRHCDEVYQRNLHGLYYSSYCRCTFLRGITVKRRRARFTPELSRTNSADFWFNWLKYFLQDPREIVHLEIAGMDYSTEIRRLKNLQQPECLEDIKEKLLRTPLPPIVTFDDDPLRILRGIRFSITKRLRVSEDMWQAMKVYDYFDKMPVCLS